jgi:flagellar hook-basal body complex protein FliE
MSISPVGAVGGSLPALPSMPAVNTAAPAGTGFDDVLVGGLENLHSMQKTTDTLAVQAATGDLKDVHEYMIAATKSSVAAEMTVAVRNRAIESFSEIMRMQV